MIEIVVSKKCTGLCGDVLPLRFFRPVQRKTKLGHMSECRDCENDRRARSRSKGPLRPAYRAWSAVEDSLVRQVYPVSGPAGCAALMPDRTESAITARAFRLGVQFVASKFSHPGKANDAPWPVPAHDYADEDRAWMATRLPVFGGGFGAAVIGRAAA